MRIRISTTRVKGDLAVTDVIRNNFETKRSKLMQLGAHYDIAHAKGLGFAALRAKHARRERETAGAKRIVAASSKVNKEVARDERNGSSVASEDKDDDDVTEQWAAICVAGLKVYTQDPDLQLELRQHPAVDRKHDVKSFIT